jgi:chromosome segregation ATPase
MGAEEQQGNSYRPYAKLREENATLKEELKDWKDAAEQRYLLNNGLESKIGALESENARLRRQRDRALNERDDLLNDRDRLARKVDELQAQRTNTWREKHAETAKELRVMRAARNYWYGLYQAREESFQEVSGDRDRLLAKVKRLNKQCQEAKEKHAETNRNFRKTNRNLRFTRAGHLYWRNQALELEKEVKSLRHDWNSLFRSNQERIRVDKEYFNTLFMNNQEAAREIDRLNRLAVKQMSRIADLEDRIGRLLPDPEDYYNG